MRDNNKNTNHLIDFLTFPLEAVDATLIALDERLKSEDFLLVQAARATLKQADRHIEQTVAALEKAVGEIDVEVKESPIHIWRSPKGFSIRPSQNKADGIKTSRAEMQLHLSIYFQAMSLDADKVGNALLKIITEAEAGQEVNHE